MSATLSAQSPITVQQLEDFLLSDHAHKFSDASLAHEFTQIQLSQQLTDDRLSVLNSRLHLGPKSALGLQVLAANSTFLPPPLRDVPQRLPPEKSAQEQILALARSSLAANARQWPDFVATRITNSFSDAPLFTQKGQKQPLVEFHLALQTRHEVTVRGGREVPFTSPPDVDPDAPPVLGLTTRGEFGPMLSMVLDDVRRGTITWSRWQTGAGGKLLAVFHYAVPSAASHDSINLCCYQVSVKEPAMVPFHAVPAYHGELILNPATGAIYGITIEDEFSTDRPIVSAQKFVRFDFVEIGGRSYLCPVRAIAVAVAEDFPTDKTLGFDRIRFINIVNFSDYHKFGSSVRVFPSN